VGTLSFNPLSMSRISGPKTFLIFHQS